MVIPSDSNKRELNSFVFNTNKTCANTKVYRGVQPKVFTEAGIRNSVQVSPTCNRNSRILVIAVLGRLASFLFSQT